MVNGDSDRLIEMVEVSSTEEGLLHCVYGKYGQYTFKEPLFLRQGFYHLHLRVLDGADIAILYRVDVYPIREVDAARFTFEAGR